MKLYYLAFSSRGLALAQKLASALGGRAERCGGPVTLAGWTADHFAQGTGLVYVGACGIAVRAVAPHLRSKETDPAVVAVDEQGHFAVPLVAGHLGGANALARAIAAACGAVPVLTTATDAAGRFPIYDWARAQGCAVADPHKIKAVSARLLDGQGIRLYSDWPIRGQPPPEVCLTGRKEDCDAALTLTDPGSPLWLVPRVLALGVAAAAAPRPGPSRRPGRPLRPARACAPKACAWCAASTARPMSRGCWNSAAAMAGPWLPIPPPSCGTRRAALPPRLL